MQDSPWVKTSYFANWRNFPKNARIISIAQFPPKGWKGEKMRSLAPSKELFEAYKAGAVSEEGYKKRYIEDLEDRGITRSTLRIFFESLGNVVLCCYEKPGDFCHRHILMDWLGYKDCEL